MTFPLELDLCKSSALTKGNFDARYQGASYLGAASTNQQQAWRITCLQPGQAYHFILEPGFLGGDLEVDDRRKFDITARIENDGRSEELARELDFSSGNSQKLTIPFVARKKHIAITLTHPYRGPKYRYLTVSRVSVELVDPDQHSAASTR
ncbi:MAG: hypothetical protein R3E84_02860 [Pseudomonadales bacterium]